MFTVYLIKVFVVGTLAFALALIKCCGVAINVAGLPNVRETLLQKIYGPPRVTEKAATYEKVWFYKNLATN